jgi:hypothetical protein
VLDTTIVSPGAKSTSSRVCTTELPAGEGADRNVHVRSRGAPCSSRKPCEYCTVTATAISAVGVRMPSSGSAVSGMRFMTARHLAPTSGISTDVSRSPCSVMVSLCVKGCASEPTSKRPP